MNDEDQIKMNLTKTEGEGYDRVLVPEGLHHGIITRIIDLGTRQKRDFDNPGATKSVREIKITFELPALMHEFDEAVGPERQEIANWYTLSFHEKSNLYKFCKSLEGSELPDEFNVFSLLGRNCMVNVIHRMKADGVTVSDKIDNVSPMVAGMATIAAKGNLHAFYFDAYSETGISGLREGEKKAIEEAPEYQNYIPF